MVNKNFTIIYKIADYIIALVLGNFGLILIKKEFWPAGVSLIITAFLLLYFSSYTSQINKNEEAIEELEKEITKTKQRVEMNENLLNTIKDIVILNKLKNLKER